MFHADTEMDDQTKGDVTRYLTSLVNESVSPGHSPGHTNVSFNERSLYGLPADENEL